MEEKKPKQYLTARKRHHVIYKTTCLVTGRYYIGMHSTDNLDDGYLGSGKRLWRSIQKHGAKNHICEVIEHLPSREALKLREAELVNKVLLKDKMCMNLTLGGGGGWDHQNSNSDVQRRKCIAGNKKQAWLKANDPVWAKQRLVKQQVASKRIRELIASGKYKPYSWLGRKHRSDTLQKMSLSKKGMYDGEANPMYGSKAMHHPTLMLEARITAQHIQQKILEGWVIGSLVRRKDLAKKQNRVSEKEAQNHERAEKLREQVRHINFQQAGWAKEVMKLTGTTYTGAKQIIAKLLPEIYASAYVNKAMSRAI